MSETEDNATGIVMDPSQIESYTQAEVESMISQLERSKNGERNNLGQDLAAIAAEFYTQKNAEKWADEQPDEQPEAKAEANDEQPDEDDEDDEQPFETCPVCGEPIDYCLGHGEIGDPEGHARLLEIEAEDDNVAVYLGEPEQPDEMSLGDLADVIETVQAEAKAEADEQPKLPLTKTEAYAIVKDARLGLRQADDRIYLGTADEVRAALEHCISAAQSLLSDLSDRGIRGLGTPKS
jgi:hypothetical protein